ncbi:polyamine ABC transporter substrate-binding protein [Tropicimonas sp. IMCC34011]|uniref:polyamine ABC transporter substrate-binding protein n=1 Tax=Tropicimonas sp. IMCC34011 TaxID=2248759 RepID=UPI000E25C174|nr:polyamine ABC transporter substrate-binding protein [Tropicimonas sp. IMCC34011]
MRSQRFKNRVVAAILTTTSLFAVSSSAVKAADLVVASYGGSFQDGQTEAFFEPYAETSGVKVTGTTGTGYAKVKAMVESGNVIWDVISADGAAYEAEVVDGLLEPIDYSVVQADGIPEEFRKEYGVAYIKFSQNLAWNKDEFPEGLTPAQFFDPEVKARRVMLGLPYYNLEFALMADGVAAEDLYPLDVDRGLAVIDRIKDQLVGFKSSSDIQAFIQQGEVDVALGPNGRLNNAIEAGANWAYGWNGSVVALEYWSVVKGAQNSDEAMKFINFAVQPEQQAELTRQIPYGPTNIEALDLLEPSLAETLPSFPANAALGVVIDSEWWNENLETVKQRWDEYVLQ